MTREEFRERFKEARRTLDASGVELSQSLRVSRPTIGRWARGESAPHPLGRKLVLEALARLEFGDPNERD